MSETLVDIIIPTYNNTNLLAQCLKSILKHKITEDLFKVTVINNGTEDSVSFLKDFNKDLISVITPGSNLGWEGGLKLGLENTSGEFVVFMNDDTYVPYSSREWVNILLRHFKDPKCAMTGPSSNMVAGFQNIWVDQNSPFAKVPFLIGFCVMVRRSALVEVGGVDDSEPYHGDDIDLSIRLRKADYYLVSDRDAFIYHHGFQTGKREFGGYWNSTGMLEKTYKALFDRHGVKEVFKTFMQPTCEPMNKQTIYRTDSEGEIIRDIVKDSDVLELGCGDQKTVPWAVGVDVIPCGGKIPGLQERVSVADIVADVTVDIPVNGKKFDVVISRHILEHCLDSISTLKMWGGLLKSGGKIVLAVPDQSKSSTIPMNFQHVVAFTPSSLKTLMETLGWHTESIQDANNGISFVGVFSKNGVSK